MSKNRAKPSNIEKSSTSNTFRFINQQVYDRNFRSEQERSSKILHIASGEASENQKDKEERKVKRRKFIEL